jgi:tetratricopeptide (TPR) repeat protein
MTHVSPDSRARLARGSETSARLEPMPSQMFMHQGAMLAPRPPLAAYRSDLARRGGRETLGPSDATWLSVATILSHAMDVPPESRPPLVATLREVVRGDPALSHAILLLGSDPPAEFELDTVSPIVRAVVEQMEDGGALTLAYSTLAILADADLRLSTLERGRVLAQMGRIAWKAGALETAREQYRRVEVLGRAGRSAELRVRAWIGYAVVARLRGNYPEVRKWSVRAAAGADKAGLVALGSLAYHSLLVAAAVAGDFDTALVYGWRAFQSAAGDPIREAEMLRDLSELLLRAGYPDPARHGFRAALARRPPERVAIPALGGLARAAAAVGDAQQVTAARMQAEHVIAGAGLPYESAAALLELADALDTVGNSEDGATCRARALQIATYHNYHEITHQAEAVRPQKTPSRTEELHALDTRATEVARAVASLAAVGSERSS